jgi:hypothetical protein
MIPLDLYMLAMNTYSRKCLCSTFRCYLLGRCGCEAQNCGKSVSLSLALLVPGGDMNNDAESDHLLTTVGWDLNKLHSEHDNFQHVPRIHAGAPMYELLAKIDEHERTGVPLVIEGFHTLETWPSATFSLETLQRYSEHESALDSVTSDLPEVNKRPANIDINVRDVRSRRDFDMSLHEFIAELGTTPSHVQPGETRRLYGKDYQCPRDWADWLGHCNSIPSVLLPHCTRNAMRNLPDPVSSKRLPEMLWTLST